MKIHDTCPWCSSSHPEMQVDCPHAFHDPARRMTSNELRHILGHTRAPESGPIECVVGGCTAEATKMYLTCDEHDPHPPARLSLREAGRPDLSLREAGRGIGLTYDEILVACQNIGYDMTCGACAAVFYTGYEGYDHTCKEGGARSALRGEKRPRTEGGLMAAVIQGALWAQARKLAADELTQPVRVVQNCDADGNYEPFFRFELASGIVLRVDVTVERERESKPR